MIPVTSINHVEELRIRKMGRLDKMEYLRNHFDTLNVDWKSNDLLKLLDYPKWSMACINIVVNKYFKLEYDMDAIISYLEEKHKGKSVDGFDLSLLSEFDMDLQDKRNILKKWRDLKSE